MKKELIFVALFISGVALADAIYLEPGEKATLNPSGETTVYCKDSATLIDKFCNCLDSGPGFMMNLQKHFIFSNGRDQLIVLGRYSSMSACKTAMEEVTACK